MCTWDELVDAIEDGLSVREAGDSWIQAEYAWVDGRQQVVDVTETQWGGKPIAMLTSPLVPYTEANAALVLQGIGVPLLLTQDGMLSVAHPLHHEDMDVDACLDAMAHLAALTDEIEKVVTGGQDARLPLRSQVEAQGAATSALDSVDSKVIPNGQWVVGTEVAPGYYRFTGYVARLDRQLGIITNESAYSGLGLILVSPHDTYFEVRGEAMRLEDFPVYDVQAQGVREGIYLAGTDLPYGTYRLHGEGSDAYFATYSSSMNLIRNDLNQNVILNLDHSVFAVEIRGRLERLA